MERQPHANVEAAGVPGLENAVRLSTGPLNNLAITAEPDSEKGELRLARRIARALFGRKIQNPDPGLVILAGDHPMQSAMSAWPGENLQPTEVAALQNQDFESRLGSLYGKSLVNSDMKTGRTTVNLTGLNKIRLHRLQRKLLLEALRVKYGMSEGKDETSEANADGRGDVGRKPDLRNSDIQDYVQALKDQEYIKSCALRGKSNDPFIVSSANPHSRLFMRECIEECFDQVQASLGSSPSDAAIELLLQIQMDLDLLEPLSTAVNIQSWDLFGGSRYKRNKKEAFEQFLERVGMAVIGGAFLIGPMLVMVLVPGQNTSLITASVCVFAFGIVVSWFLEKKFDVLSATAAYAAVLVVFVGTSTGVASVG
ncbi:hypothetical protein ACEPPN_005830 [Leptodophora sp. 'Broadleaf-Isolate-01']